MTITIDGTRYTCLISCHIDDTFTFYHNGEWVIKSLTVPYSVLHDPELPDQEYYRVHDALVLLGRVPVKPN